MEISGLIKNSKSVLIVGHMRPDGDCFGSGLALLRLCQNLNTPADFVCDSALSEVYSFMTGFDSVNHAASTDYDLLFVVDCGDDARMGKYIEYLKKVPVTVNIDHHLTNDGFAKINIVEPARSSTCELVFDLLDKEGVIDEVMASCLYVGLSTDTGHFVHNTTTPNVFRVAARLLDLGANASEIADHLYKNRSVAKTKLIARAINSLRFFEDNSICIVSIFAKDLEESGCTLSDTEGLIDYASSIGSVRVSACVAEQKDRVFKVSLRSKGLNVASVAASFGGGGHLRAAGCMLHGFYEDVIAKLERAIKLQQDCEQSI